MASSSPIRSPEIEAVTARMFRLFESGDVDSFEQLTSLGPWFTAIGTDPEEWWDAASFVPIVAAQAVEMADMVIETTHVEGWERGDTAWAAARVTVTVGDSSVEMRITAVYTMESGVWRLVQWHASEGVPNEESLGYALTTTLTEILDSLDIERDFADVAGEGMVILMFTDVADSTVHAREMGDRAFTDLMTGHIELVSDVAARHGGQVIKAVGDGTLVVFSSARAGLDAAVEIQRATEELDAPYAIRIGLHAGDVIRTDTDVMGFAVNKAARVTSAASGGQIVVSSVMRELVGFHAPYLFGDSVLAELKGIPGVHELVQIDWRTASVSASDP